MRLLGTDKQANKVTDYQGNPELHQIDDILQQGNVLLPAIVGALLLQQIVQRLLVLGIGETQEHEHFENDCQLGVYVAERRSAQSPEERSKHNGKERPPDDYRGFLA